MSTTKNDGKISINDYNSDMTQMFNSFLFADMYTIDLPLSQKAHFYVKWQAYRILDEHYTSTYNTTIDPILMYKESLDDVVVDSDKCSHYLIKELYKVLNVLQSVIALPKYQYNMFVFLPMMKQMKHISRFYKNDFCCKKLISKIDTTLDELMATAQKYIEVIQLIQERAQIMKVFMEPTLYKCHICLGTSLDLNFLKPNECCGYDMCYMCYSNLWKFCSVYPVCPVCKTSFKTSNQSTNKASSDDEVAIFTET